ncbi:4-hydroxy-tetrahydrodipicolinate reductase [Aerococcaceae bacterium WGS1372]
MNIILIGSDGAMGKVIQSLAPLMNHKVVIGLQATQSDESDLLIVTSFKEMEEQMDRFNIEADVMIDFSTPKLTEELLEFAVKHKLPIMLATTGQTADQEALIHESGKDIAIIDAHNTSIGVNVMEKIVEQMTSILSPLGYDIEIIEKHHRYKQDSPSGTAKMLLDAVKKGMIEEPSIVYGREGTETQRQINEVGVHAIRGGDIVGEHSVIFANNQEVIELTHRAGSKELFARGALSAAEFLAKQCENGIYSMNDIF